jgi:hypothetical protein
MNKHIRCIYTHLVQVYIKVKAHICFVNLIFGIWFLVWFGFFFLSSEMKFFYLFSCNISLVGRKKREKARCFHLLRFVGNN